MADMRSAVLCLLLSAGPLLFAEDALDRAIGAHKIPAMTMVLIRNGVAQQEVVRGVRTVDRPDPAKRNERWLLPDCPATSRTRRMCSRG
jgi:hypothetical protein